MPSNNKEFTAAFVAAAAAQRQSSREYILTKVLPSAYLTPEHSGLFSQTATKFKKPWCEEENPIPEKECKKQIDRPPTYLEPKECRACVMNPQYYINQAAIQIHLSLKSAKEEQIENAFLDISNDFLKAYTETQIHVLYLRIAISLKFFNREELGSKYTIAKEALNKMEKDKLDDLGWNKVGLKNWYNVTTREVVSTTLSLTLLDCLGVMKLEGDLNLFEVTGPDEQFYGFFEDFSLPESFGNLIVGRDLLLQNNRLSSLPESFGNITVGGDLLLQDNKLSSLPDSFGKLEVGGALYLQNNQLSSLPKSFGKLKVGGDLLLNNNQLESLPKSFDNITVGGDLLLQNNQLEFLPESFGNLKGKLFE